jgi:hypothetical protein
MRTGTTGAQAEQPGRGARVLTLAAACRALFAIFPDSASKQVN